MIRNQTLAVIAALALAVIAALALAGCTTDRPKIIAIGAHVDEAGWLEIDLLVTNDRPGGTFVDTNVRCVGFDKRHVATAVAEAFERVPASTVAQFEATVKPLGPVVTVECGVV